MQQQKRVKPALCITRYAVLLVWLAAIGIAGCQQPAKSLIKEQNPEKSTTPASPKPAKPNTKSGGNTNNTQNNGQGESVYQGLDIPDSLARSPQRLRELITQGEQHETEPYFNDQGMVVKYVEKEVVHDISAAFDDTLLLDPSQNSIYPGSVLRGDSLDKESYQAITEGNKRKAIISFDLQGVKGKDGKPGITSGEIIPN